MNKRPLIFVIALTLSLFLLNQYFSSQESKKRESYLAEVRKKEVEALHESIQDVQNKTAPVSSLPIVQLYEDKAGTKLATLAIVQGSQYLTTSWDSSIPKMLYLGKENQSKPVDLRIAPQKKGDPVLYGMDQHSSLLVAFPPDTGNFDVQIVTFIENNKEAKISLGVVQQGRFIGPVEPITQKGIVLYKEEGSYLPWGIYDPASYMFAGLPTLPYFASITLAEAPTKGVVSDHADEQFYVLENDYQQLVFSSIGGALAEINLPFYSEQNKKSVVLPIDFDRVMEKDYPFNDRFPIFPFLSPQSPTTLKEGSTGGYYPLIRRAVMAARSHTAGPISPHYYALNVIDRDQDETSSRTRYTLKRFEKNRIEFEAVLNNRTITKTFVLPKDPDLAPYAFELYVTVEGDIGNLQLTSGVPEVELISDSFSPSLKYRIVNGDEGSIETLSLPKDMFDSETIHPDWVSNSNGFFGIIIDPLPKNSPGLIAHFVPGNLAPSRLTMIDARYHLYPAEKYPGYECHVPLDKDKKTSHFLIYAGPYTKSTFERVDAAYYSQSQGKGPDFESAQSVQGWFSFISEPFAKFLFFLMTFFHYVTHSWGISIILLTIALRIMLYPLNAWSIRSTLRMQEIAPHVQALQARYKKDPKRAQMEIMHLYREKGVNPLSGCFPLLIQLPFLIGMFDLLKSTFELRGAGFIPGWINDLAAPDVIFSWGYPIFFIGHQFHLLPILLGAVMYLQQRFSAAATLSSNQPMTDQQRQQKFMGNIMVVVFTVMFYNFPSGLNIYWLSSMLLGILQQWWMTKKTKTNMVEVIK